MLWTVYQVKTPLGVYTGVTSRNPRTRFSEVKSRRKFTDAELVIVATFRSKAAALKRERKLAPVWDHDLNVAPGGGSYPKRPGEYRGEKRINIAGKEYESLHAAARALGVKVTTVQYRLNSPYFEDWTYVTPSRSEYTEKLFASRPRHAAKRNNHRLP